MSDGLAVETRAEDTSAAGRLRAQAYRQRQQVNRLRDLVYAQADPTGSPALLDQLVAAETTLAQVEQQAAEAEQAARKRPGVLGGPRRAPGVLGAASTKLSAEATVAMAQVPTSFYHLLDPDETPLVTCTVTNVSDQIRRVRVISFVEGFTARAVSTAELQPTEGQKSFTFKHLPLFFPDAVARLDEVTRAMLNIQVEDLDSGKTELHLTQPVWLLARTSAPMWIRSQQSSLWISLAHYLGAFVTPNAPAILQFLRGAVDLNPGQMLMGYQDDRTQVEPQVKALYLALQQQGIKYVNSVVQFSPDDSYTNQRVRLPRESLAHKEANCMDGAVLFASLLEAISLSPGLVLVPGHAFVAWETWSEDPKGWNFLETTLIGTKSFEDARRAGDEQARKWYAEFQKTKDSAQFTLLSLQNLRKVRKIYPME